jgi:hypothetical protein
LISSENVAESPPPEQPGTLAPIDITEICTVLPAAPPNDEKVCGVIVVCNVLESTNEVGNAVPFHMIRDRCEKFSPLTVRTDDSVSSDIAGGDMDTIWGVALWQVFKAPMALQVVQAESSKVTTTTQARRTQGSDLRG